MFLIILLILHKVQLTIIMDSHQYYNQSAQERQLLLIDILCNNQKGASCITYMDQFKIQHHRKLIDWNCKLTSPLATNSANYCVTQNGDVLKLHADAPANEKQGQTVEPEVVFTILGCPSAIAMRALNTTFLIADLAHQSIFLRDDSQVEQIHNLISEYNERAFSGPSSLAVNDYFSHLYFTDSGPFGETSLENKAGSLYVYNFEDKSLRSLAFRKLANPCGIALDPEEKFLIACEMGENRLIKFVLDEHNSGNYTVFHQFTGRMGPSAITFYNGFYYVSLYEFNDISSQGMLAILNEEGDLVEKILVPTGPEISGLQFLPPSLENNHMVALITQSNSLYEITFKGDKMENQQESEGMNELPK